MTCLGRSHACDTVHESELGGGDDSVLDVDAVSQFQQCSVMADLSRLLRQIY
jgi:hypothetical protein